MDISTAESEEGTTRPSIIGKTLTTDNLSLDPLHPSLVSKSCAPNDHPAPASGRFHLSFLGSSGPPAASMASSRPESQLADERSTIGLST